MNATWIARPAVLPAMELQVAACTLARHASVAAASSRVPSRSSAPDALTVRNAPNMRSSEAPIAPTDSCARLEARLMCGTTTPMTTTASPSAARVTASMTGSSSAISTMVAPSVSAPVTPLTTVDVVTSRSSVVSEVTRAIRSPGSCGSTADTRRRSSRPSRPRRAVSTTDSAVRRRT